MRCPLARLRILLAALVIGLVVVAPARADFMITGGNALVAVPVTIPPGGASMVTGTVDFTISSGDNLADFGLELLITPLGTTSSFLQFSDLSVQPNPYDDSGYVFNNGASGDQDSSSSFWFKLVSAVTGNDTIRGGDFNNGLNGYPTITPSSDFLASVQFQGDVSPGDSFSISLKSDQFTYFDDSSGAASYSSTDAIVTVTASDMIPDTGAAPAPSALALAGIGALTCLLSCLRSRIKRGRSVQPLNAP